MKSLKANGHYKGFNLKKVAGVVGADGVINDDLVIYKSGLKFDESTPRVTIKNYPFSLVKPAFGINLDLKVIGLGPSFNSYDKTINPIVYASSSPKGEFFAPVLIDNDKNYGVRLYDHDGVAIKTQALTNLHYVIDDTHSYQADFRSSGQSCRTANGDVAFIYSTTEMTTLRTGPVFLKEEYVQN